jgi:hypothetical protein
VLWCKRAGAARETSRVRTHGRLMLALTSSAASVVLQIRFRVPGTDAP